MHAMLVSIYNMPMDKSSIEKFQIKMHAMLVSIISIPMDKKIEFYRYSVQLYIWP